MKLKTEKTLHHEGLNEAQDDFNRSAALRSFAAQIEQRERQWEPDEFGVRFDSCPACGRHKRFSSDSHQVGFSTVQTWRCGYKRCGFLYFITYDPCAAVERDGQLVAVGHTARYATAAGWPEERW